MAAPAPAAPAADPIAAPAAAPSAVPTNALPTPALFAACAGLAPPVTAEA